MLVYVVYDNNEPDLCGVFSTEQKALEVVEEMVERYRPDIDITIKQPFVRAKDEWSHTFYIDELDVNITLYCIMIDRIV